jgi:hypothetical protein
LEEKYIVRNGFSPLFFLFLILIPLPFFGENQLSAGEESSLMVIELGGRNGGGKIVRFRVEEAATLCLSYIHSLYRTPQEEVYTIQDESLILREMHFGNLEAAGYYDPHPDGDLYREGNLWKVKMSPPVSFPVLRMRVPFTGPLLLLIDGHTAWASRQKDQGALLTVKVVHEDPGGETGKKSQKKGEDLKAGDRM